VIDARILVTMLAALVFVAGASIGIVRWIMTGRGPGVRLLVLCS
jgi:hypothetical protein